MHFTFIHSIFTLIISLTLYFCSIFTLIIFLLHPILSHFTLFHLKSVKLCLTSLNFKCYLFVTLQIVWTFVLQQLAGWKSNARMVLLWYLSIQGTITTVVKAAVTTMKAKMETVLGIPLHWSICCCDICSLQCETQWLFGVHLFFLMNRTPDRQQLANPCWQCDLQLGSWCVSTWQCMGGI